MAANTLGTYKTIGQESGYDCGYFAGFVLGLSTINQKFSQAQVYRARDEFRTSQGLPAVQDGGVATERHFALDYGRQAVKYLQSRGLPSGYQWQNDHSVAKEESDMAMFIFKNVGVLGTDRKMLIAVGDATSQHWIAIAARDGEIKHPSCYYYDPNLNAVPFSGLTPISHLANAIGTYFRGAVYRRG